MVDGDSVCFFHRGRSGVTEISKGDFYFFGARSKFETCMFARNKM